MTSNEVVFDFAKRTADMMVDMFGSHCEVAVHDFSNLDQSLIHLAGSVTNRGIGSPATNLVLEELKKSASEVSDIPNYKTHTKEGVMLKSATVFLRDKSSMVIGALCMNYDLNSLMSLEGMIHDFLSFDDKQGKSEDFYTSIHDVIKGMVDQVSKNFSKAPASLSLNEKVEFTGQLDKRGAFLIKGSTDYVATILGVSKFTIYNYLQKANTQEQFFSNQEA